MKLLARLFILLVTVSGCALDPALTDEDVENLSTTTDAITDGSPAPNDPAVVFIFHQLDATGRGMACTGTVIRSRSVLTAAHCIPESYVDAFVVFAYDVRSSARRIIRIVDRRIYPGYDGGGKGRDLAVLELASPAGVTPAKMNASFTRFWNVGDPVRMLGYGDRDPGPTTVLGLRYQGEGEIALRQANNNVVIGKAPSAVLPGDSGGPTFAPCSTGECVVGVHSVVYLDAQGQPLYSGDTAVDPYYAWIATTAAILEAF